MNGVRNWLFVTTSILSLLENPYVYLLLSVAMPPASNTSHES